MMRKLLRFGFRTFNDVLRPLGFRLHKVHSPTRSFLDFFNHLRTLDHVAKTVVDIGVAHGTPAIYDAFPGAKYIFVEPLREFIPTLEALKRNLDATYHIAAAGARDGEIEINVHDDLSGSSVFGQAEGAVLDGSPRHVPALRLESILPSLIERPALLKVDTQGAELDVIEGLGTRLREFDVIIMETSLLPLRKKAPELADVVGYMRNRGWVVYDILEGHVRSLDNALAQVDLVFVPHDGALRRNGAFFSPEQLAKYVRQSTSLSSEHA
jgi:FkbM family methyltransferase